MNGTSYGLLGDITYRQALRSFSNHQATARDSSLGASRWGEIARLIYNVPDE